MPTRDTLRSHLRRAERSRERYVARRAAQGRPVTREWRPTGRGSTRGPELSRALDSHDWPSVVAALKALTVWRMSCWLWQGDHLFGRPRFRYKGEFLYARREMARAYLGGQYPRWVRMDCGIKLCLNPDHMVVPGDGA